MPASFPATPLFHYSSLADLTALLDTQSLTLTPLDQPDELNAVLSFIQNVIVTAYPALNANLFNIAPYPVFSFSLTAQVDSANLWQNFYPAGGFAISIDPTQLSTVMDADQLELKQCLYDDTEKTNFIISTIVDCSRDIPDSDNAMFAKRIREINRGILNYAGILKDASRSGEQEWRIIARYNWTNILMGPTDPPDALPLPIVNNSVAAPLISPPYTNVNVQQIVIGPHADMAQAKADCDQLVSTYGLTSAVITESAVPYQ